jgi:hypothetical protein
VDIAQLSQLPLTVLVILGAYWVIQRINDEHGKKLVELIAQFSKEYTALINRAAEEREESRQRWIERDRLLITTLVEHQKASQDHAQQTHNLRTALTPLVLWWEREQGAAKRRPRGEDADAANRDR